MDPSKEEWRAVAGYDGKYLVSNHGRVARAGRGRGTGTIFIINPTNKEDVVAVVSLRYMGRSRHGRVAGMVMAAFVGPCPDGMEVCHGDGDHMNNRLSNLRYGTHTENMADKHVHGTQPMGETSHYAKLTESAVLHIRATVANKSMSRHALATMYGIREKSISDIVLRKSWKHI